VNNNKIKWSKPSLLTVSAQTVHGYCSSVGTLASVQSIAVCTGGNGGAAQLTCATGSTANERCNTGTDALTPAMCNNGSYANNGACQSGDHEVAAGAGARCAIGNSP
jgi:hypothetical protein